MKKALKVTLLVLAALLAVLIAGAAWIAATFNPNDYKPQLIQLVKEETGRTLAIPGDIRLTFFPRIGAQLGKLSLSEARSEQVFAAAEQVHVSVALLPLFKKEVRVDRVLVDGLNLQVLKDAHGHFNFDDLLSASKSADKPATAPAPAPAPTETAPLPLLDIGGITVSNARLDYRDAATGKQLRIADLQFKTGPIADGKKAALELGADITGSQPALKLKLALRGDYTPALAQKQVLLENLALSIGGSAASLQDLQLKLGLARVEASAERISAQGVSLDLAAPNPAGGTVALQAQGQASADLARETAQLALDGKFDSTTLALKAGVQHFAQPAITFDLALGELDADRYRPKTQAAAAPAGGASPAPATEAPIDLGALRGLDVRGALKIGALKVMNVKASNLRVQTRVQGGRAELSPVTATLYEGGVNGVISADAGGGQRLAAKLDLRGIQIGPLMKDLLEQQPLDGRGNVAVDVSTGGNTVSQFKRKLNGTVGAQLADGAIRGVDIAGALRGAKAKLGGGGQEGQAATQQKTDFSEFKASLKITDGVARNDDLSAKTPLLRLGGNGTVYIAEDRLDYTLRATLVATLEGQGGAELDQLKGLTIPVHLSGPYNAIAWKLDLGAGLGDRAREATDQRKRELQQEAQKRLDEEKAKAEQRLREQATDQLKNLLRR